MTIRAKFRVTSLTKHYHGQLSAVTVRLQPEYDQSIPEDRRFYESIPSGTFEMLTNNPAAVEQLTLGRAFYIDLTPIDE